MEKQEKIGSVKLNFEYYGGKDLYCDGSVEDELLEIVTKYEESDFDRVIAARRKWPILYHLSKVRWNAVEWLPSDRSARVLEIGSGCGAITGCLAGKFKSVTCVELSKKRSTINAERNKQRDNIEIYVGNFQDIAKGMDSGFDIITLIGVFEYGGLYINSVSPYVDFLKLIKTLLNPGGTLVMAIENRLGMKYWAGCREDHTGRFYDSIEGYPIENGVKTFSKKELEDMLSDAGYDRQEFYYPYPDYKFAGTVYSDAYLPKKGELNNNMRNFDNDRFVAFDEKMAFDSVIEAGLFPQFSNSYIVLAGGDKK